MTSTIDDVVKNSMRKKKISELAKSIKRKYLALKLGKSEEDDTLQKLFRPIAEPLKEIVHTSHKLDKKISTLQPFVIKKEDVEGVKKEEIKEEDNPSISKQTSFQPLQEVASTSDDEYDDSDVDDRDESRFENISTDALAEYVDQYPPISQKYVEEHWREDDQIDKNYGPVYDASNSSWRLGQKRMDFEQRSGNIIIDGLQFKGTPGVYQLIFYSDPSFNDEDKAQYKQILELTNAHKDAIGRLKGSTSQKYQHVIRPLFVPRPSRLNRPLVSKTPPPPPTRPTKRLGKGFNRNLIYNTKPMEYVYWDDPNELVDRLRLLIASREAGNTSHVNEILAIENELREAKIIS